MDGHTSVRVLIVLKVLAHCVCMHGPLKKVAHTLLKSPSVSLRLAEDEQWCRTKECCDSKVEMVSGFITSDHLKLCSLDKSLF